jgi:hypothetical protein
MNRIFPILFDMNNRILGPYLAATHRIGSGLAEGSRSRERAPLGALVIAETNRTQSVLFGMHHSAFVPYFRTIRRVLVSVVRGCSRPQQHARSADPSGLFLAWRSATCQGRQPTRRRPAAALRHPVCPATPARRRRRLPVQRTPAPSRRPAQVCIRSVTGLGLCVSYTCTCELGPGVSYTCTCESGPGVSCTYVRTRRILYLCVRIRSRHILYLYQYGRRTPRLRPRRGATAEKASVQMALVEIECCVFGIGRCFGPSAGCRSGRAML